MQVRFSRLSELNVSSLAFFAMLLVVTAIYWTGLNSPFILDDYENLTGIGSHEHLGVWRDMLLFALNHGASPTGRPVSLASFYINDWAWEGATPFSFKYTNLMIHLLNGVLVFWLSVQLAYKTRLPNNTANILALCAATLWMLHPMQVNTVLYVIQRMTELGALFTLTGLLCYLQGRSALIHKPLYGWLWFIFGTGISLLLAVFSKENGALLVVYILAIEYFLIRPQENQPPPSLNKALLVMAWLPFTLLAYFLLFVVTPPENYANRPFSLGERLLTETRVVWDYIGNILLPNWKGNSLFHDDFVLSTGWLTPLSTLPAALGIVALAVSAFLLRKKQPVAAFAIAWFFGGHLMESTTIALEIYFEHRNYLPLFGFAFAIPYYLIKASQQFGKVRWLLRVTFGLYLLLLSGITLHYAQLWTKPPEMVISWLEEHPHSQRTLELLDTMLGEHMPPAERSKLLAELKQASINSNTASYLILKQLVQECTVGTLQPEKLQSALSELESAGFVSVAAELYANLISEWIDQQCGQNIDAATIQAFSTELQNIPQLQQGYMPYLLEYWQAQIQLSEGNLGETMRHMEAAYALRPDVDLLLLQTTYLSSAGLVNEAMEKLAHAEQDLCTNWRQCLILKARRPDIDNMRVLLEQKLLKEAKVTPHEQVLPVDHIARQK